MGNQDKIVGCLVGGALGDALAGVAERGQVCLSDDTQMTLATCEAIQQSGGVSPEAIAGAFCRWFRKGAITGIGSSTLKALRDLDSNAHWALSGARGEMTAGNGAAMRIAPLAFVLDAHDREHRRTIRDICRITHHSDEAYLGALSVMLAIQHDGEQKNSQFFSEICAALPDSRVRDRLIDFAELDPDSPVADVVSRYGSSGYVVETVPLALLVALRMKPKTFESALRELAETVEDADTIGSIAGQIGGARLGLAQMPQELVSVPIIADVHSAAERFAAFAVRD